MAFVVLHAAGVILARIVVPRTALMAGPRVDARSAVKLFWGNRSEALERQIATGKRGRIPENCKPILEGLGIDGKSWVQLVKNFGRLFKRAAGTEKSLRQRAESTGQRWHQSAGGAALLGGSG